MPYKFLCLVMGLCSVPIFAQNSKFRRVHEWGQLEFDFPSAASRQLAIDNGAFLPGKPAPIDVDVYFGQNQEKIFVTIPRFQAGVPVTLGTAGPSKTGKSPVIRPYPSWSWHQNPHLCSRDRIVSVYRVQVDKCGRLWVLDTGRLLEEQTCEPQILAFDLRTDQLLYRYTIPKSQLESRSILVTPIVDIRESCADTFVYVADCQTFSIIVYDVRHGTSWRATDKTMYPYPNFGTFKIQGEQFDLMDGVLGMALEPYFPGRDPKLFYHAMSSATENWVYTSHLRNRSLFEHDPSSSPHLFHPYEGTRKSQSAAEAIDRSGIAYFGQMTETMINCWNTATEYGSKNIDLVEYNPKTLQFASGVKVIDHPNGHQELWVLTSRFQKVATGSLNPTETNFRIQATKIDDALRGTKCKIHGTSSVPYTSKYGGVIHANTGGYGFASTTRPTDKLYFPN